jgi:hypothetical protein
MRLRYMPIVVLLLVATSLPAFAQWRWGRPHPPRAGACFYKDGNFRGDFFCLKEGERWPNMPAGFNDRISSIRVFGGSRLRIFTDAEFRGASLLLDRDADNLSRIPLPDNRGKSWNDRITSIAVFRDRDEWLDRLPRDRDDNRRPGDRDDRDRVPR